MLFPRRKSVAQKPGGGLLDVLSIWYLEFFCLLVIFGALTAMVIILVYHANLPLPDWPYSLSINSILAILAVTLKVPLLFIMAEGLSQLKWTWFRVSRPMIDISRFDQASRGPWGSLKLLYTLRLRDVVASTGALATVTAIAIDPFTQQIIHYFDCPIPTPGAAASIQRTSTYDTDNKDMSASITSVFYQALYAPQSLTTPFVCSTGNCTFPQQYHSVAWCSSCEDISSDVSLKCYNETQRVFTCQYADPNIVTAYCNSADGIMCNYKLPYGLNVSDSDYSTQEYFAIGLSPQQRQYADHGAYSQTFDTIAGGITAVGLKRCLEGSKDETWNCRGYGAARCQLYGCIKSWRASITNNVLEETTTGEFSEIRIGYGIPYASALRIDCLTPSVRRKLVQLGHNITENTSWIGWDGYGINATNSSLGITATTVPQECLYQIDPNILTGVFNYLGFIGWEDGGLEATGPYLENGVSDLQVFQQPVNGISFDGVNKVFANLAHSLTLAMRTFNGTVRESAGNVLEHAAVNPPAFGNTWQMRTCVRVRWAWLVFPASLALLAVVFLLAMIAVTARDERRRDWKSESLAVLIHGLEEDAEEGEPLPDRVDDMRRYARETTVRLRQTQAGWKLARSVP